MGPVKRREIVGAMLGVGLLLPAVAMANETTELERLKERLSHQEVVIQQQQATIQQLLEKMQAFEVRLGGGHAAPPASGARVNLEAEDLAALPPDVIQQPAGSLPVKLGGYIDVGYVDPAGSGRTSTGALQVNSRADNLATLGLDGDSSFLVNEVNLDVVARPTPQAEAVANVAFLPRKLTITSTGGSAFTDAFEVNEAYLAYQPFPEGSGPVIDNLFGDLKLSLGKFESPMGIEYRFNKAPDRVNISRSMMSIYWTGYPVGIKARGKLFKDPLSEFRNSLLSYTLALANGEPWISRLADMDRATNSKRTVMGRLAYGLDVLPGAFLESGVSLAHGPRINQGDNNTTADSIDVDARLEWGPLTVRAEYDYSNLDRPRTGGTAATFSHLYLEGFYEIPKPGWWPRLIPLASLTPYYRYDTRNFNVTAVTGGLPTLQEVKRHTFALRYLLTTGRMLKAEYQLVGEAENASTNDNAFLASFVQAF